MAHPKSPGRRRDLLLLAAGIDAGGNPAVSVDEADWLALAAVALAQHQAPPPFDPITTG